MDLTFELTTEHMIDLIRLQPKIAKEHYANISQIS